MRTRHILTALALPALFAACTADEFETVNQNTGLQEERAKVAENFTLLTSGIQTRYSVEGGAGISFNFEKGDQIGAAIIDKYNPNNPDEPEKFDVIYSLAGNNPFEFQGNDEWTSNTQLGIGHYLFVYPYNKADNNRAAVAYELPVIQELGAGADGLNAAIEKGNKAVAAAVLHEGEESVDISLKNLFTYPKLTINFDNGENVTTVSQIVLRSNYDEKDFIVKGGFNHKVLAAMFDPNEDNKEYLKDTYYKDWDKTGEAYVDWENKEGTVDTYDFLIGTSKTDVDGDSEDESLYVPFEEGRTSDYIIVKFPEGTKVQPAANTNNKYVEARIMMPSIANFETLTAGVKDANGKWTTEPTYTLFVYTDNGVYSTPFTKSSFSFKETTSDEAIKTALQRNKSNTLTLKALTSANKGEDAGTIVTTLADWNNLVAKFGKTKQDQDVIIVGDDFAFDATAEWPETCTFTINADVNVEGEVAFENVTVDGTINVKKGATLTVNNTLSDKDAETKIVNEGTVVIAAEYDQNYYETKNKAKVAYDGIDFIANKGTLTVNEKANAKFALTNIENAVVNNNGAIEVSDGEKVNPTYEGGNHGTINNNGIMRTTGFTNQKVKKNNAGTAIEYIPVINNAKGGQILAESGDFINYASLVNEGELTCKDKSGNIYNNGAVVTYGTGENKKEYYPILDSKEGALTYITGNATGAIIKVYSDDPEMVTIGKNNEGNNGWVVYEAKDEESVNTKESCVNVIVANGDLTIENESKLDALVTNAEGTLTWGDAKATDETAPVVKSLNIKEGTLTLATLAEELTITISEKLTVAEGAQMTVPENESFEFGGQPGGYSNEGTILVGGSFKAGNVQRGDDDVRSYGDSEIVWAPSAADDAKEEYQKTLDKMVQAFILSGSKDSWSVITTGTGSLWESGNWDKNASSKTNLTAGTTYGELVDAAYEAYKEWAAADEKITSYKNSNEWLTKEFRVENTNTYGMTKKILEDYQGYGKNNMKDAFLAVKEGNSWLGSNSTFYKEKKDAKFADITDGTNTIAKKFAEAMVTEGGNAVNFATDEDTDLKAVHNKAIQLSLKAATAGDVQESWIPDYSWIELFEGSKHHEYEVMAGLLTLETVVGTAGENWFKEGESTSKTDIDLTKLTGIQKVLANIYDDYKNGTNELGYAVNKAIKDSKVMDYIDDAYEWEFNDVQISTLNSKVTELLN